MDSGPAQQVPAPENICLHSVVSAKIIALAEKWEGVSRRKFLSAERQKEGRVSDKPTGQQFIEHGARCYFNCAQELRECLTALSPSSIATQKEDQK